MTERTPTGRRSPAVGDGDAPPAHGAGEGHGVRAKDATGGAAAATPARDAGTGPARSSGDASWLGLAALLVLLGAGWGLTQPLAKIAVSGGYRHFGLVFWQLAIGAVLLGAVIRATGRPMPLDRRRVAFCGLIAVIGTVIPGAASFQAAVHLPSGILSVVLSLVPMLAFPVALWLGIDRFGIARALGLACGLAGVVVLALPGVSLPSPGMIAWLPLALVAPLFYAIEGNVVARWGTRGLDPIQVLFGASVLGTAIALPLALGSGHWIDPRPPWGLPDLAVALSAAIHAAVYSGYVWLVGHAGSVFAAQVSYLVTGSGVLWAMALLGERYPPGLWIALGLMFLGLFLVRPRRRSDVASPPPLRKDAAG